MFTPSDEQSKVFKFMKKDMVVSASAGSGKTTTLVEFIAHLIINHQAQIKRMLILTFTKAAASDMKEKLMAKMLSEMQNESVREQLDDLMVSDISTIHAFLEKLLKRNIAFLPELEGFSVLDEKEAQKIMSETFAESIEEFKTAHFEKYKKLVFTIRSQETIREIMFLMNSFFSAQAGREEKLKYFCENIDLFVEKSKQYLNEKISTTVNKILNKLNDIFEENDKINSYLNEIKDLLNKIKSSSLLENLITLNEIKLPRQPILKNCSSAEQITEIKEMTMALLKLPEKFNLFNKDYWSGKQTKENILALYDLYKIFNAKYKERKVEVNSLDFNDLEWQSELVLSNPVLLEEIQQRFDFVFIDEYQDTNPVQEKLMKAIAQKAKFIAFGDPKQGIYGFRNATSKIILSDSENFSQKSDGETIYLTNSFRSDKEILEFVNSVFVNVMNDENTGIDYRKTSLLKGENKTAKTKFPSVEIDVVKKVKATKRDWSDGYDIFDDPLVCDDNAMIEAKVVAIKVEEFLSQKFYNEKTQEFRQVKPSDIAILTRNRSDVSEAVVNELRKRKIPFVSTLRSDLTSKAHVKLLLSILSLCTNFRDDVSLAAFLLSPFVKISLKDLALLRIKKNEPLWATVEASDNEKILKALTIFNEFKNNCFFYGAKKAFEKLINQTNFYSYLYNELGENGVKDIEAFLSVVQSYKNDKDLPELLAYLNGGVMLSSTASADAVTISTIHACKGLEYPIVILIGTGKPLLKIDSSSYKINEELGLALSFYDSENYEKFASPLLLVEKEMAKKQERIDELMVLYVALTRAKAHLVITGSLGEGKSSKQTLSFERYSSFMSLILSNQKGAVVNEIEDVQENEMLSLKTNAKDKDDSVIQKIKDYEGFVYPFEVQTQTKQKTSVTELSSVGKEFVGIDPIFSETGTAYHEALKTIDFEKVENREDVKNQLINKKFDKNLINLINFDLIFENIKIIQPLIKNKKIFKEKQFVLKLDNGQLVQGIIDLFAIGEKNILIDYKFTKEKDENTLKNRYFTQLMLYKNAIEKAENIKINNVYLISLLNKKIITY